MKNSRKLTVLFLCFVLSLPLFACKDSSNTTVNVTNFAGEGLDLEAAGKVAAESKDADDFAARLNSQKDGVGVNNLDLNEDGKPELLVATEDNTGNPDLKVFVLTAVLSGQDLKGKTGKALLDDSSIQKQHVADFKFERESGNGQVVSGASPTYAMTVTGNDQIYGNNNHHHCSGLSVSDMLLLNWMFAPRPYYYPVYTAWYPSYGVVPMSTYRTTTVTRYRTVNTRMSYSNSVPASSRAASYRPASTTRYSSDRISAPLRSPSAAQSSFQKQNPSKQFSGGGFARSNSNSNSSSGSSGRSSGYSGGSSSSGSSGRSSGYSGGSSSGRSSGSSSSSGRSGRR